MKAIAATTCLAVLLVVAGCRPMKVETGYDPGADFSARKTYAWRDGAPNLDTGDPRFDNPQMQEQIRRVVEAELADKGFEKAAAGTPGFLLECAAAVGSASTTVTRYLRSDDSLQDWRWTGTSTASYEKGILVLDMTDPTTGRPLWRAAASAVLKERADATERRERLAKALRKMLERFPPKR